MKKKFILAMIVTATAIIGTHNIVVGCADISTEMKHLAIIVTHAAFKRGENYVRSHKNNAGAVLP